MMRKLLLPEALVKSMPLVKNKSRLLLTNQNFDESDKSGVKVST